MRNLFVLVYILILSFYVNSQFMPQEGAVLEYKAEMPLSLPPKPDTLFKIIVGADTIINGQKCNSFIANYSICSNFDFKAYVFEKDSIVYFFKDSSVVFDTLYDFTKNKNEHWKISFSENIYFIVQVDSVYNTLLNGGNYKTLDVTYFIYEKDNFTKEFKNWNKYCSKIVEKFGDISYYFHLTLAESDCIGSYMSKGLSKFIDSDTISIEGVFDFCLPQKIVGLTKNKNFSQLNCSPNPTTGMLHISGLGSQDLESYQLFSATGERIETELISSTLDASKLIEGIYFLRLNFTQGVQTLKFLKE